MEEHVDEKGEMLAQLKEEFMMICNKKQILQSHNTIIRE